MSWSFDGVDDQVPSGTETLGAIWSVGAWVNPVDLGELSNGYALAVGSGTPSSGRFYLAVANAPVVNAFFLQVGRGTDGRYQTPANSVVFNKWQHVLFTYDGTVASNDPLFYYNGQPLTLARSQLGSGPQPSDAQVIYIGNSSGTTRTWRGLIGQVAIWPRILTPVEVANLFVIGPALYPDYGWYWPGDNLDAAQSPQQFPRGNRALTVAGALAAENPAPWRAVGRRG
jgi:hypothetical protein